MMYICIFSASSSRHKAAFDLVVEAINNDHGVNCSAKRLFSLLFVVSCIGSDVFPVPTLILILCETTP